MNPDLARDPDTRWQLVDDIPRRGGCEIFLGRKRIGNRPA